MCQWQCRLPEKRFSYENTQFRSETDSVTVSNSLSLSASCLLLEMPLVTIDQAAVSTNASTVLPTAPANCAARGREEKEGVFTLDEWLLSFPLLSRSRSLSCPSIPPATHRRNHVSQRMCCRRLQESGAWRVVTRVHFSVFSRSFLFFP